MVKFKQKSYEDSITQRNFRFNERYFVFFDVGYFIAGPSIWRPAITNVWHFAMTDYAYGRLLDRETDARG